MEMIETDWLKRWDRYSPDAVAIQDADTGSSYTYALLYRLACELSDELRLNFDIRAGDRVAALAANEMEYLPLFFATQRLGAILVPVNIRLTAHEIDHIVGDAAPKLLIAQNAFMNTVARLTPPRAPMRIWSFDAAESSLRAHISEITRRTTAEARVQSSATCVHEWETDFLGTFDDPCMILYTSGTTGAPKGALITHKMMFWNSVSTGLRLNLTQADATVSFLPFFHTAGWHVLNTPLLHRGGRIVLMRKFEAEQALRLCESEQVTLLFGVPTTMDRMSRAPRFETLDFSRVRYAIVGGEPMPIDLITHWQARGVPIRQGFGLTEFGPNAFSLPEKDSLRKIGSIGFPNFYVGTRIVDEHGVDVEDGEIGELLLRGPARSPGYWNPTTGANDPAHDEWLPTGDLVRRDSEGYFYVAGRKKDMFISGGENVYPAEVERVISAHPLVREVAVVGVPDEKWGEVGKAYIALVEGADLSAEDLLAHCRERLARFKTPRYVEFLDDLPKGDSGKIMKRLLRQQGA